MSKTLKPCPFCGDGVILIKHKCHYYGGYERTYWQIRHRCKFDNYLETKYCGTKTEAARYWNKRVSE